MHAWPPVFRPNFAFSGSYPHLSLFDSLKGAKVELPVRDPMTIYVCGITPYDATHIGHAATYLTFDLVHRYLLAAGHRVVFLENVTDIDDPLFERARRDGVKWKTLVDDQLRLFTSDMTNLRVLPPIELTSVTEAMEEIIAFVGSLVAKGLTYSLGSELYLDARRVTDFGDLPLSMESARAIFRERGGDPDRSGKRHPLDPVLWRPSAEDEPRWSTPFGEGRPGWHVECNAIARKIVEAASQNSLSLQGGGGDLIFPHHYMTELQSRARYDQPFSQVFAHAGMVKYQGEKMSKSLGNLVFVSKLLEDGVHPMAIRIALISGHYREEREWSDVLLGVGEKLVDDLLSLLSRELIPEYDYLISEIITSLADDLDTPRVLVILQDYIVRAMHDTQPSKSPGDLSRFLDAVLGVTL
jgi:L-cysteine:1D-myo-inositol 2-amino-2-deoxy-alpha-D-glucopyranoside ligase